MYVLVMVVGDAIPDIVGPFTTAREAHVVRMTTYHYVPNHLIAVVPVISVAEYEGEVH